MITSLRAERSEARQSTSGLLRRLTAPRNDVFGAVLFVILITLFSSCYRTSDPLIGWWTVEKVNVEFNEQIATPEMVRQYGDMEKGNVIEISKDSVLTFISEGDTLKAQCSLKGQQLYCDGVVFGILKDGKLVTESNSPIGTIVVTYHQ